MSPPRAAKCKRAAGRVVVEFDTTSGMSSPSFGDGHDRSYGSGSSSLGESQRCGESEPFGDSQPPGG